MSRIGRKTRPLHEIIDQNHACEDIDKSGGENNSSFGLAEPLRNLPGIKAPLKKKLKAKVQNSSIQVHTKYSENFKSNHVVVNGNHIRNSILVVAENLNHGSPPTCPTQPSTSLSYSAKGDCSYPLNRRQSCAPLSSTMHTEERDEYHILDTFQEPIASFLKCLVKEHQASSQGVTPPNLLETISHISKGACGIKNLTKISSLGEDASMKARGNISSFTSLLNHEIPSDEDFQDDYLAEPRETHVGLNTSRKSKMPPNNDSQGGALVHSRKDISSLNIQDDGHTHTPSEIFEDGHDNFMEPRGTHLGLNYTSKKSAMPLNDDAQCGFSMNSRRDASSLNNVNSPTRITIEGFEDGHENFVEPERNHYGLNTSRQSTMPQNDGSHIGLSMNSRRCTSQGDFFNHSRRVTSSINNANNPTRTPIERFADGHENFLETRSIHHELNTSRQPTMPSMDCPQGVFSNHARQDISSSNNTNNPTRTAIGDLRSTAQGNPMGENTRMTTRSIAHNVPSIPKPRYRGASKLSTLLPPRGQVHKCLFNDRGAPIGKVAKILTNYLGICAKKGMHFPLYKAWGADHIKGFESCMDDVMEIYEFYMLDGETIANMQDVVYWCYTNLQKKVRSWRCRLRSKWDTFKRQGQECQETLDPRVTSWEWKQLLEYWESPTKQEECTRNKINRSGPRPTHRTGAKSYSRCYHEWIEEGAISSEKKAYLKYHQGANGEYLDDYTKRKCEEVALKCEQRQLQRSTNHQDFIRVLDDVHGEHHGGYERGYGIGASRQRWKASHLQRVQMIPYLRQQARIKELEAEVACLKERTRQDNREGTSNSREPHTSSSRNDIQQNYSPQVSRGPCGH